MPGVPAQRLEWLDDVDLVERRGHGALINYAIAQPLVRNIVHTLQARPQLLA